MKNMKYELEVKGHEPPYKWVVYKSGGTLTSRTQAGKGEADSMDEAIRLGHVAAKKAERDRRHAATVEKMVLFEVDEAFAVIEPDALDLENWPVAEPVRPNPETEPVVDDQFADPFPYEPPAMEFED